jgi:transcription initiation factor TFIID subunit 1
MEVEDDALGSAFGLGGILAEMGVESSGLSGMLERGNASGKASRDLAAAIEADGKFMEDVSDEELPDENDEDRAARAREQAAIRAEEDRWARRAAAEMRGAPNMSAAERKKRREREENEKDVVRKIWPDFTQGTLLRMSEIFYETPADRASYATALLGNKRRMVERTIGREERELALRCMELTRQSPSLSRPDHQPSHTSSRTCPRSSTRT